MSARLIALIDGSAYSRSVCDHAAWIGERAGLAVELMHVLGRREGGAGRDLSGSIALGARSALLAELASIDAQRARLAVRRGRAILEDARAIIEEAGATATEHLRHGDLVEAVAEREAGAAMIVIGKRGEAAAVAPGHLGSNLERVMRTVRKPLLIATRAFRPPDRVLIAFDGSSSALRAIDHVARNPLFKGLAVTVMTVGPETSVAQAALSQARETLAAAGVPAGAEIVAGHADEVLGHVLGARDIDLLVMGASGHSRLRSLFVGSTSLEMVRSQRVPVLIVR